MQDYVIQQTTTSKYLHHYRNGYRLEDGLVGAVRFTLEQANATIAKTTIPNLVAIQE